MDKNKIIIIGLVIVIIALFAGIVFMMQSPSKEDTKLTVISKNKLNEGDNIKVKLTDLNGTPISGESVNISFNDGDDYSVVTNDKGVGVLKLDKNAGKYTINCTYGGNSNYTGNNTTQKLTIKEVVEEAVVSETSVESSEPVEDNSIYYDEKLNVYYDSDRVVVDPDGHHSMEVGSSYDDLLERQEKWERGELDI